MGKLFKTSNAKVSFSCKLTTMPKSRREFHEALGPGLPALEADRSGLPPEHYLAVEPRVMTKNPKLAEARPPIRSQIALLVGDPVKNRETSELNESDALNPKMISTIPTTNSAMPRA